MMLYKVISAVLITAHERYLRIPFYSAWHKRKEEKRRDEENRKIPLRDVEAGFLTASCLSICKDIASKSL